jgi:hypothetical protein
MKDTARKMTRRQEATPQLAFAAMLDARATLHDAIVSAGMGVLSAMLEEERAQLCGPRYAHQVGRSATRSGHTDGELALGGQRIRVRRPRVRSADGKEVRLETWDRFASADPLTPRAVEQSERTCASSRWCSVSRRASTFARSSLHRRASRLAARARARSVDDSWCPRAKISER